MAEYIEKDAAIREIHKVYQEISQEKDIEKIVGGGAYLLDMGASEAIIALPAADVRENVSARWECIHEKGGYLICHCSNCGIEQDYEPGASFCKYCGADMSGMIEITNADRIRAMSDEELAKMLTTAGCPVGLWYGHEMCRIGHTSDKAEPEHCHDCWLGWLRSSVEVTE